MAEVHLRGALRGRASSRDELLVSGATLGELLRELERSEPGVEGWILDERGRIRPHINVFVNGERGSEETAVSDSDRVEILPAISGG
jgi:molybdopterin converting factor small subunit